MLLKGHIRLHKRLRRHPVYDRDPKCAMAAWTDMIMLANDEDRVVHLNGKDIPVKRGQLVWSLRSLAREWKRSEEWIAKFLQFCKDETMVLVEYVRGSHTLITILNYDVYNPLRTDTDSDTEPDTDSDTQTVTKPEQKGERGKGNREVGSGSTTHFRSPAGNRAAHGGGHRPAATSPAQALFLVDRELAEVNAEIDGLDDLNQPVPKPLRERKRDLEKKRGELLKTSSPNA